MKTITLDSKEFTTDELRLMYETNTPLMIQLLYTEYLKHYLNNDSVEKMACEVAGHLEFIFDCFEPDEKPTIEVFLRMALRIEVATMFMYLIYGVISNEDDSEEEIAEFASIFNEQNFNGEINVTILLNDFTNFRMNEETFVACERVVLNAIYDNPMFCKVFLNQIIAGEMMRCVAIGRFNQVQQENEMLRKELDNLKN